MKINWGTGVVIAFAAFITFILYFVVRMNTGQGTDHELVTTDYYKRELAFQQEIEAAKNVIDLDERMYISTSESGIHLHFPTLMNPEKITGTVFLYRPSNRHLDSDFPLRLSNTHLLIPDSSLVDGRWNITVEWQYLGKPFLYKHELYY